MTTNAPNNADPSEAMPAPLPSADPTCELAADLVAASSGDFTDEHRGLLAEAARTIEDLRWSGGCTLSGLGRGDCSNTVGLPGKSSPGQHDGPDDTVDAYGRPNGWCQRCWDGHRISELRAGVSPSEALFGFVGWLTSRSETSGPFSSRHDASGAAALVGEWCDANQLLEPRDDFGDRIVWPAADRTVKDPETGQPVRLGLSGGPTTSEKG